MSQPPQSPHTVPSQDDALLQRYREANELDTARPSDTLRENVLAHARHQLDTTAAPSQPTPAAANDPQWKLRALGSLAVVGLIGLLVMQFDRGTPEEQELALGNPRQRNEVPAELSEPKKPAASEDAAAAVNPVSPETAQPPAAKQAAPRPSPPAPAPARPAPQAAQERHGTAKAPAASSPKEEQASSQSGTSADAAPARRAQAQKVPPASSAPAAAERAAPDAFSQRTQPAGETADAPQAPALAPPSPASPSSAPEIDRNEDLRERVPHGRALGSGAISSAQRSPPLHNAVASGQKDKVQQLLAQGVDINARNAQGRTALMLAAMGSDSSLIEMLMKAGADPDLRDPAGLRASDFAQQAGHADWLPLFSIPPR
jgi:hypothetical protein